ncbi:MAG: hypothetical protein PVI09_22220, partial [Anaerolineae bacterium]
MEAEFLVYPTLRWAQVPDAPLGTSTRRSAGHKYPTLRWAQVPDAPLGTSTRRSAGHKYPTLRW